MSYNKTELMKIDNEEFSQYLNEINYTVMQNN